MNNNSWFEVSLSFRFTHDCKLKGRERVELFRAKRKNLVEWNVKIKCNTKAEAVKELKKIPSKYRKLYDIHEVMSIPELDALFI